MANFIEQCFRFFSERFNLFLILVKEAQRLIFSDDPVRSSYFSRQQSSVMETLASPLQDAMDRGELRQVPPTLLASVLFGNIKGVQMRQCLLHPDGPECTPRHDTRDMVVFLTDFILDGVSMPESEPAA